MLMKKLVKTLVIVTAAVSFSAPAFAEKKIGLVELPTITQKSPQAKSAEALLEKEFAPRERKLVSLRDEIQSMESKYKKDAVIMTDSQKLKMEREIRAHKRDLERSIKELREDLNLRRNQELTKFQDKVRETIEKFGKENGFDLIISQTGVLYSSKAVNITDDILDVLVKEYGARNQ